MPHTQTKTSTAVKVAVITLLVGGIAAAAASIKIGQPKCPAISNKQITVKTNLNLPIGIENISMTAIPKTQAEGSDMDKNCEDLLLGGKVCEFQYNALVTITVKTKDKFKVTSFSGNCKNPTMNDATRTYKCEADSVPGSAILNVTAVIDRAEADIVVNGANGKISETTKPWACMLPGTCNKQAYQKQSQSITILGAPSQGYFFKKWEGCKSTKIVDGGENTKNGECSITVDGDKNLSIEFTKKTACGPLKPDFVGYNAKGELINDCFNFKTDFYHCGKYEGAGSVCATGQICQNGACACDATHTACNNICIPKTILKTDPKNCGTCGNVCGTDKPVCQNGACLSLQACSGPAKYGAPLLPGSITATAKDGTVKQYSDSCSGNSLTEYYCDGKVAYKTSYTCSNRCADNGKNCFGVGYTPHTGDTPLNQ